MMHDKSWSWKKVLFASLAFIEKHSFRIFSAHTVLRSEWLVHKHLLVTCEAYEISPTYRWCIVYPLWCTNYGELSSTFGVRTAIANNRSVFVCQTLIIIGTFSNWWEKCPLYLTAIRSIFIPRRKKTTLTRCYNDVIKMISYSVKYYDNLLRNNYGSISDCERV